MEWFNNFHNFSPMEEESFTGGFSPFQLPLPALSPPPPQPQPRSQPQPQPQPPSITLMDIPMAVPMANVPNDWTYEQNKLFENAVAEVDPASVTFFEELAAQVPSKSVGEIQSHYDALAYDVGMIESGNNDISVTDYPPVELELELAVVNPTTSPQKVQDTKGKGKGKGVVKKASPSSSKSKSNYSAKTNKNGQPRRRGIPWTHDEHMLFLMGLNKYGKGDWVSISRGYLITKSPTQIASHAQKYFRRQNSTTPLSRRRPSINDINTSNLRPIHTGTAAAAKSRSSFPSPPPYHHISFGSGAHVLTQSPPPFMAANNGFNNPPPSIFFPSPLNQQWG